MYELVVGIMLVMNPPVIATPQPWTKPFATLAACKKAEKEVVRQFGGPGRDGKWRLIDASCERIKSMTASTRGY